MKKIYSLLVLIAMMLAVFLSLYSLSTSAWVWENGFLYQRIFGTTSGLAAFSGLLATIKFYQRKQNAYLYALLNALLFGIYALSVNLIGDFIVNIIWYIPVMIYFYKKIRRGNNIKVHIVNPINFLIFALLFTFSYVFFWFINPLLNQVWGNILNLNVEYGINFTFSFFGKALDVLMNSISIVAMVMMIMGIKAAWYVWIPKNIAGLIFFSGVGVFNFSIILMNALYLLITIFIIFQNHNSYSLKIAIVGPGAIGKTTIISHMKQFLLANRFAIISERNLFVNANFNQYMYDMHTSAFRIQKHFFAQRMKQIEMMAFKSRALIDRHLIDDFIFPRVHIKLGNFSPNQAYQWTKIEKGYWKKLTAMPKLDFLFIIRASDKIIETRRIKRSQDGQFRQNEVLNHSFFKEVNAQYQSNTSILAKAASKFAKRVFTFENSDSQITARAIIKIIRKSISGQK